MCYRAKGKQSAKTAYAMQQRDGCLCTVCVCVCGVRGADSIVRDYCCWQASSWGGVECSNHACLIPSNPGTRWRGSGRHAIRLVRFVVPASPEAAAHAGGRVRQ